MFNIEDDLTIHLTRGDTASFNLTAENGGEAHTFVPGDVARLKVFEKKACHCVVLQKDFVVQEESTTVPIALTDEDTKIGEVISKPVDYWYEIELNPDVQPQTIVGYDEDGGKVFRLYPEGGDY